ncbi:hypothetical protein ACIRPT_26770 [Streptomyces sp. NPDC101227]|uniref:hypothetical protein n=1 Tax=Streptomyces sp. NPDC101227 TaxID=3366136 RepID=UPI003802650C
MVLASRVRDVHAAWVWLPLGHASWASHCEVEFGIFRAQACRLLDVARALAAIHGALAAGTDLSRTRDTGPAAAAALDYGRYQRALIAVSGRTDDIARLITGRLATLADCGPDALSEPTVRVVVRQAARDVRSAPPADPPADPTLAALRRFVDDLAVSTHVIGELMLGVAPRTCPTPLRPTSSPRCTRSSPICLWILRVRPVTCAALRDSGSRRSLMLLTGRWRQTRSRSLLSSMAAARVRRRPSKVHPTVTSPMAMILEAP